MNWIIKWSDKSNGEEYYNGVLIFKGEYLYGQRWKGKEYRRFDDNSYIIIEGEYIDGKIKGKCKQLNNGELTF